MNPTKGPWKVEGLRVMDSNGNLVAGCSAAGRSLEEAQANAELIAASALIVESIRALLLDVAGGNYGAEALSDLKTLLVGDTINDIEESEK